MIHLAETTTNTFHQRKKKCMQVLPRRKLEISDKTSRDVCHVYKCYDDDDNTIFYLSSRIMKLRNTSIVSRFCDRKEVEPML